MIIIHEGVPGSGKSYDAVRKIIDALKLGRTIYTNIDGMNNDSCLEYLAQKIGSTRDDLQTRLVFLPNAIIPEFWNHVKEGGFIVIDEAQLYFNSRDFVKTSNREFGDWASTHRHHGYDLLLITQRAERIDTSVRSLAEFKYRYRKLNVFGSIIKKSYLIYTHAGEDPKHLAMRKAVYDVSIFPCYQSYVGDATEKKIIRLPNLLNHPIFYSLAIVLIAALYFGANSPLLRGELIHTPKLDKLKADIAAGKVPDKQNLYKVSPDSSRTNEAPALVAEPRLIDDVIDFAEVVRLQLDGLIVTSKGAFMTSGGFRLSDVIRYDRDTMTAWVPRGSVPPGLNL